MFCKTICSQCGTLTIERTSLSCLIVSLFSVLYYLCWCSGVFHLENAHSISLEILSGARLVGLSWVRSVTESNAAADSKPFEVAVLISVCRMVCDLWSFENKLP